MFVFFKNICSGQQPGLGLLQWISSVVVALGLWLRPVEMRSPTRIETWPPALGAWSLHHWTASEVPVSTF